MKRRDFLRHASLLAAASLSPMPLAAMAEADPVSAFLASSYPDLNGGDVPLSTYAGRPLVVNFWATWCAPCVKEMPDLAALSKKYGDMNFVGIAIDTRAAVARCLQHVPVSCPLRGAGQAGLDVMKRWGNRQGVLPYTVIFGADSTGLRQILGQGDPAELDSYLAKL